MRVKTLFILFFISLLAACGGTSNAEPEQEENNHQDVSETTDDTTSETMQEEQTEQVRVCQTTHSKVGQTGELHTLAHSVSGTVTVINDCTIEITNFNFDGGGIIVEVYGGVGGNYHSPTGFSLSDNIVGTAYNNQTLTVQLPENKTLDDLNGISIWCTDVGVSFGDSLLN